MELSIEDFEYAGYIASKYCRPKEFDGCLRIEQEAMQHAWVIYKGWYTESFTELKDQFEIYNSNADIQNKLTAFRLDSYKFWVLLLFTRDLVTATISSHIDLSPSIRQEASSIKELLDNSSGDFSIIMDGRKLEITHAFIISSIKELMDDIVSTSTNEFDFASLNGISEIKNIHRVKKTTELLREFLDLKIPSNRAGKMSFIGKMLFLSGFVDSEDYLTGKHITGQLTQKNSWKLKTGKAELITINNRQYLYEPFDVGKHLADAIKKCTECDFNCSITSLFYDPVF